MPNYFFDTYGRNISQNEPIMVHIVITLISYNFILWTIKLKNNLKKLK